MRCPASKESGLGGATSQTSRNARAREHGGAKDLHQPTRQACVVCGPAAVSRNPPARGHSQSPIGHAGSRSCCGMRYCATTLGRPYRTPIAALKLAIS